MFWNRKNGGLTASQAAEMNKKIDDILALLTPVLRKKRSTGVEARGRKRWTAREVTYLATHKGDTVADIARALNRTEPAVASKMWKLGLSSHGRRKGVSLT